MFVLRQKAPAGTSKLDAPSCAEAVDVNLGCEGFDSAFLICLLAFDVSEGKCCVPLRHMSGGFDNYRVE